MKIVIDTNLMISAMYFGGRPKKLIDLLIKGRLNAYASSFAPNQQISFLIFGDKSVTLN